MSTPPTPLPPVVGPGSGATPAVPVEVVQTAIDQVAMWLTVLGTLAAAIVPLILFLRERQDRIAAEAQRDAAEARERQLQETYRQRDEAERDRAQAELVHAWTGFVDGVVVLYLANSSLMPVTWMTIQARIYFTDGSGGHHEPLETLSTLILPPTGTSPMMCTPRELIRSTTEIVEDWPADWKPTLAVVTGIAFKDARGRRWRRDVEGNLSRVATDGSEVPRPATGTV